MKKILVFLLLVIILTSCSRDEMSLDNPNPPDGEREVIDEKNVEADNTQVIEVDIINEAGKTIGTRLNAPRGYKRTEVIEDSFGEYLRNLPLKPHGSKVLYYDGGEKSRNVYVAVLDIDVGNRDLQQCADAVMRLRGEYLFKNEEYDKIHFNFTNGFRVDYSKWIAGKRVVVEGNNCYWVNKTGYSNTYEDFRKYMNIIFAYAGTLSLSNELEAINPHELMIGDVIIKGGSPGHAVIVVDMAENEDGKKIFLLAQSYMPAQSIHVLKNPMNEDLSPWYELDFEGQLFTPEWTFTKEDFKRFPRD